MIKRGFNIPTNDSKIYKQFLSLLNFSLNATPQEREVLAEIIQLNNEYEALPPKQRAKFILSTDMRKEMRDNIGIEEKQFNTVLSRLRKKTIFGKPVFDEDGVLTDILVIKSDSDGLQLKINLVNTISKNQEKTVAKTEEKQELEEKTVNTAKEEISEIDESTERKLAKDANGTDNIIEEMPSGFIVLQQPDE